MARRRICRLHSVAERGKGSHGTVYLGSKGTILKDRTKEIGLGLLSKMFDHLGVDKMEF
jgi:mRNA interferase HicA